MFSGVHGVTIENTQNLLNLHELLTILTKKQINWVALKFVVRYFKVTSLLNLAEMNASGLDRHLIINVFLAVGQFDLTLSIFISIVPTVRVVFRNESASMT